MDIKIVFGKVLRQARKEKQISQERLALEADVDRSYISKLETGAYQPSMSMLFALSGVLQIRPSELVRRVEEQYGEKG
ncbi:MAG: helix-turn-helix transcriptional regulator [Gammaproteobacteria bacterium]|nr:helix-turn-helix transcriptional regulator [Gammaproteobacteria bacterium]MCP5138022.1 helix-turn-helix transcriptional regulator [Gammaproteobacteria bacterium]